MEGLKDVGLVSQPNFMAVPAASQGYAPQMAPVVYESVIPNPKLKLLDQMREVMRLKHYSLRVLPQLARPRVYLESADTL